jgi:hypothetical protein
MSMNTQSILHRGIICPGCVDVRVRFGVSVSAGDATCDAQARRSAPERNWQTVAAWKTSINSELQGSQ